MKMTFSQIEAFYWIARLGSFRAAANQLNLTQPTISLRIRSLEEALGMPLLQRAGRGTRLTDRGRTLLPDVDQIMRLTGELTRRNLDDPLHGSLRLGAPATIALSCITRVLEELESRNAHLDVDITINKSSILQEMLNEREIDVAIVVEPSVKPHVRTAPLGIMKHAWIASPRLGLSRRTIGPADLMPHRIFMQAEPSALVTLMVSWFGSAGLEPKRFSKCENINVIARLVAAGKGVSILSPSIVESELRRGEVEVLKVRPALVRLRLYLAYQVAKAGPGMELVNEVLRGAIAASTILAHR